MPERLPREAIPRRVAAELRDGDYVNLGVGLPMQIPAFVPPSTRVMFHAENGVIGFGPRASHGEEDSNPRARSGDSSRLDERTGYDPRARSGDYSRLDERTGYDPRARSGDYSR